jgi:hypothetical protein
MRLMFCCALVLMSVAFGQVTRAGRTACALLPLQSRDPTVRGA